MFRRYLVKFFREGTAQNLIEYSLLIAFLALATAALLSQSGTSISGIWSTANSTLAAGSTSGDVDHGH